MSRKRKGNTANVDTPPLSLVLSKSKKKQQTRQQPDAKPSARRKFFILIAVGLMIGFGAAVTVLRGGAGGFDKLNGRWLRTDGGYVLEIKSVDPAGRVVAAYYNPNPINVAKAEATRDGSTMNLFVELRAPNYPGSTYTLTYDSQQDQLKGIYFQAVEQQNFNVYFVRMNK